LAEVSGSADLGWKPSGQSCHGQTSGYHRSESLVSSQQHAIYPNLVWIYGQRFCRDQLFCDQKSRNFQLERSGLRDPIRIDRLLLVVAISVLISHLQGYALSLAGERRRADSHWKRRISFARIELPWLQQSVISAGRALLA
jgi:hypothetical protein